MQNGNSMPPCPICGASGEFRTWEQIIGNVRVTTAAHKFNGVPIQALVCTRCGNMQLFISPQDYDRRR